MMPVMIFLTFIFLKKKIISYDYFYLFLFDFLNNIIGAYSVFRPGEVFKKFHCYQKVNMKSAWAHVNALFR